MSIISVGIDALLAKFRSAPQLRGVDVYDGDEATTPTAGSFLVVGLDVEDVYPVDGTSAIAGLAGPRRQDVVTIACLAFAASGGKSMKSVRDEADRLYQAAREVIEADTRLGGAVTFAEVVTYSYRPQPTERGAACQIEFRVQVTSV